MAVAAETLEHTNYEFVDSIDELAEARSAEFHVAEQLLQSRRDDYAAGNTESYIPVDALSTAHKVIEAEETYGHESPEASERFDGLVLDCQRLVGEWYRKNKPEYFEPVRQRFEPVTEDFYSHGLPIRQMTENGLVPLADSPEEESRRLNERVEEATPLLVRKIGGVAVGSVAIRTVSECTDKAISDYEKDQADHRPYSGYNGYVPEIQKVMIRDIRLDTASQDRFEEQIGLPGTFITHFIIQEALARKGVDAHSMDKTQLHGSQLLVQDDLLSFAELLDTVASEMWCTAIFMGEVVDKDHKKDYEAFRQEALERKKNLKNMVGSTALFILDLARDNFDRRLAPAQVEEFVKILLLKVAKQDSSVATHMFDEKTALGLRQVASFESQGLHQQANELMKSVEKAAPGGGYCGAGSCGLESVSSAEDAKAVERLGFDPKNTLLDKGDRKCKNCHSRTVVYDISKAKKGCTNCSATASYKK